VRRDPYITPQSPLLFLATTSQTDWLSHLLKCLSLPLSRVLTLALIKKRGGREFVVEKWGC